MNASFSLFGLLAIVLLVGLIALVAVVLGAGVRRKDSFDATAERLALLEEENARLNAELRALQKKGLDRKLTH